MSKKAEKETNYLLQGKNGDRLKESISQIRKQHEQIPRNIPSNANVSSTARSNNS